MERVPKDEEREERIANEAVVDAYGPEEQAIGWYTYLDQWLHFPFRAKCISERLSSPLRLGTTVEVSNMAPEDECERDIFVVIRWGDRDPAVPLAQLAPLRVDADTAQAIGDWHYWVARSYTF